MKIIVMMRGPVEKRSELAQKILDALNSDIDNIRAIMVRASTWMGRSGEDDDASAAYTTCKNYLKKFMSHMNESVFIVDNENDKPDTWRSYRSICSKFHDQHRIIGIDVSDEFSDKFRAEVDEFHRGDLDVAEFARRF